MSIICQPDWHSNAVKSQQTSAANALKVVCEGTAGPAEGDCFEVRPGRSATVGRGVEADLQFSDALMSRQHFAIEDGEHGFRLRDLESSNGTLLNGRPIRNLLIRDGDLIEAGLSRFHVRLVPCDGTEQGSEPQQQAGETGRPAETQLDPTLVPQPEARVLAGVAAGTGCAAAAASVSANAAPVQTAPVGAAPQDGTSPQGEANEPPQTAFLHETAAEIAARYEMDEGARELLTAEQSPREFLQALGEKGLHAEAAAFVASGLPKRAAVWWACRCVRLAWGEELPADEAEALEAAELWLRDPSDANRRAAMRQAEAREFQTAASWAAVGAFWSEGSLAPPEAPAVPPADDLAPRAVVGAVKLAALVPDPQRIGENLQAFLAEALEIESGRSHWQGAGVGDQGSGDGG